jgi:RNA exonuclease 1
MELLRVTVVAADGHLVYDSLVRPENCIVGYNTILGITARDLNEHATKSLQEVQNRLMGFINADTILVGHGLETDLRVLCIIHGSVVETSVIFSHPDGLPYRHSLKSLVSYFLERNIQQGSSGHCSFEDAWACMELMLWRIRTDFNNILQSRVQNFFSSMINSHVCTNKLFSYC